MNLRARCILGTAIVAAAIAVLPAGSSAAPVRADTAGHVQAAPSLWNNYGRSVPIYVCPSTRCALANWVANGSTVKMWYWTDCLWYSGNYASPRWFLIDYWNNTWEGWVHSSYVRNQVPTWYWGYWSNSACR
jgi:hypothetical protein